MKASLYEWAAMKVKTLINLCLEVFHPCEENLAPVSQDICLNLAQV